MSSSNLIPTTKAHGGEIPEVGARARVWRTHPITHLRARIIASFSAAALGAGLWNAAFAIVDNVNSKAWAVTFTIGAVIGTIAAVMAYLASTRRFQRISVSDRGIAHVIGGWASELIFFHEIGRVRVERIWLTAFLDCADVVLITGNGNILFRRIADPYGLRDEIDRQHAASRD